MDGQQCATGGLQSLAVRLKQPSKSDFFDGNAGRIRCAARHSISLRQRPIVKGTMQYFLFVKMPKKSCKPKKIAYDKERERTKTTQAVLNSKRG
jgi:hypothetical protein